MFNIVNKMDENQTLLFIEAYKAVKLLWDANHADYCNKFKRNDALEYIGNEFNLDASAVKVKIKNLRSYFSKERQKTLKKNPVLGLMKHTSRRGLRISHFFLSRIVQRREEQKTVNKNTKTLKNPI